MSGPAPAGGGVPEEEQEALYAAYVAELRARWPRLRIIAKADSRFQRLIGLVLQGLTCGGQRTYMTHYVTTLGARIYLPTGWDERSAGSRYCTLRHEAVHVAQFRRWTWPLMVLLYLLLPLPVGLAGGRAWLEWEGYRETLTATWQVYGPAAARDPDLADAIVARFTGPDYGWMWLRGKTIRAAIARHLQRLEAAGPEALAAS